LRRPCLRSMECQCLVAMSRQSHHDHSMS
jgi:hypothetical protein